jgi:hypothetical protein
VCVCVCERSLLQRGNEGTGTIKTDHRGTGVIKTGLITEV